MIAQRKAKYFSLCIPQINILSYNYLTNPMTVLVINQQLFFFLVYYKIYTEKRTLKENTEITDTKNLFSYM